MELNDLEKISDYAWCIPMQGPMRVPAIIYASEDLVAQMDMKVQEQITNVASLPGIVKAAYAMPDAHWGYGFPIGGVAAFDPNEDGIISAGGVGFDISCGVRMLQTGLQRSDIEAVKEKLADALFAEIPAGVGVQSYIRLKQKEMEQMLRGGARWAIEQGFGEGADLERIEEGGCMKGARPEEVSDRAKKRQRGEMGTLGSGNHYLELQEVVEIFDENAAAALGLNKNDIVISIHCGSRGLGHQIGTEFLKSMVMAAKGFGIELPDRELACAPINSDLGQSYIGAMRAGINCALANRQILTHFTRNIFHQLLPDARLRILYDVSHNTCKEEMHSIDGSNKRLFVHRKGATRAFGPGNIELPSPLDQIGQPVIIGGSMGTSSYLLAGTQESETLAFSSSCHGAGRAMSRHEAKRRWKGEQLIADLAAKGILIRSKSYRGVAEEAPGAYKEVNSVVDSAHNIGLSKKIVRLSPVICVKG